VCYFSLFFVVVNLDCSNIRPLGEFNVYLSNDEAFDLQVHVRQVVS